MTTCHIAVLHCAQTHNTALAHFDGCDTETGVNKMVKTLIEISQEGKDWMRFFQIGLLYFFYFKEITSWTDSIAEAGLIMAYLVF